MKELVTPDGMRFHTQAFLKIHGQYYEIDALRDDLKREVMTAINRQGLNAAFSGQARFSVCDGTSISEVLREIEAEGKGGPVPQ